MDLFFLFIYLFAVDPKPILEFTLEELILFLNEPNLRMFTSISELTGPVHLLACVQDMLENQITQMKPTHHRNSESTNSKPSLGSNQGSWSYEGSAYHHCANFNANSNLNTNNQHFNIPLVSRSAHLVLPPGGHGGVPQACKGSR